MPGDEIRTFQRPRLFAIEVEASVSPESVHIVASNPHPTRGIWMQSSRCQRANAGTNEYMTMYSIPYGQSFSKLYSPYIRVPLRYALDGRRVAEKDLCGVTMS
jgi:hypothetical protein